ncbi:large ribosomal subunit protein bL21m isoform X1 [Aquarana catesbeiana]|uniref:large ribosomal subunit protein bL21m isoform X1 n=1 Tax=Aquarana catesbeiana TaxID=8400 RepID=UPI003CC98645
MALAGCRLLVRSVLGARGVGAAAAVTLLRPSLRYMCSQSSSLQPSYVPKTSLSEPPWPKIKLPDIIEETEQHRELVKNVNNLIATGQFGRLFAVVHFASKQWKITDEDLVLIHVPVEAQCGDRIRLEKVLLVGSDNFTLIGKPLLGKDLVRVEATVIEKTESHPKINMKFWRRHRYQKKKIIVTPQTILRINSIEIAPVLS